MASGFAKLVAGQEVVVGGLGPLHFAVVGGEGVAAHFPPTSQAVVPVGSPEVGSVFGAAATLHKGPKVAHRLAHTLEIAESDIVHGHEILKSERRRVEGIRVGEDVEF